MKCFSFLYVGHIRWLLVRCWRLMDALLINSSCCLVVQPQNNNSLARKWLYGDPHILRYTFLSIVACYPIHEQNHCQSYAFICRLLNGLLPSLLVSSCEIPIQTSNPVHEQIRHMEVRVPAHAYSHNAGTGFAMLKGQGGSCSRYSPLDVRPAVISAFIVGGYLYY